MALRLRAREDLGVFEEWAGEPVPSYELAFRKSVAMDLRSIPIRLFDESLSESKPSGKVSVPMH